MNDMTPISEAIALPALIDRAAQALSNARSSAEILEARDMAGMIYDAAKKAARLASAKGAFNTVVAAAHRAQADALEIEASAKRRLADEYDEAQERGEVQSAGGKRGNQFGIIPAENNAPKLQELGFTAKALHEARIIRDAEEAEPGIVKRALEEALEKGEEPTRAKVKRAVLAKSKRKRHAKPQFNSAAESQHDRDLRMLLGVWEAACESARTDFLNQVVQ